MKTAHFLFSHWCTVVHTEVLGSPTKTCWMSKPSVGGKEFRCIISRPASERWQWPLGGQSCLPYLRAVIFLLTTPSGSFLYDSFFSPQRRAFRSFVSVLIAQKKEPGSLVGSCFPGCFGVHYWSLIFQIILSTMYSKCRRILSPEELVCNWWRQQVERKP